MPATENRHATSFPATYGEALARFEAFRPSLPEYAARRNHVEPGHRNVSRLSPALRTRALLESEVVDAAMERHPLHEVEKFVQEVYWRLYWKGWLEMRPSVWGAYTRQLARWSHETPRRAVAVMRGESGVAVMDAFARELVETGYLHNHARMWFASYWVHVEQLPWELGAYFFMRHLLDGDAASNTLSWRWVAGLHTRGKQYIVRRSNIERYCDPAFVAEHSLGLERLEHVEPWCPSHGGTEHPPAVELQGDDKAMAMLPDRCGLWIHDEDLSPERSELADTSPVSIRTFDLHHAWRKAGWSQLKIDHLDRSLRDASARAQERFGVETSTVQTQDLADSLRAWAEGEALDAIVTLRPFTGPLADQLPAVERKLAPVGCKLLTLRRQRDSDVMRLATAGFFGFWKKAIRALDREPR